MKDVEFMYQDKSIYEFMFTIDFNASEKVKKFITDFSFSYTSWVNIEQLAMSYQKAD